MGYTNDGFGIYGRFGEGGKELRVDDLDTWHGHTHQVTWDEQPATMYHYHFTAAYPYTVGCLRGTVTSVSIQNSAQVPRIGGSGPRPGPGGEAVLSAAAQELGVSVMVLRTALGPPPPDFARAARVLGLEETTIRAALHKARRQVTLTTFGGLAPMIFETSRQARFMIPMTISLGYGIVLATSITLILVPCLYLIVDDVTRVGSFVMAPADEPDAALSQRESVL